MAEPNNSRWKAQNTTTQDRLTTTTVGLVALSDFRKRRAAVLEEQEREAHEAARSGTSTPDKAGGDKGDGSGQPVKKKKKEKKGKAGRKLLSFDDEEEGEEDGGSDKPKKDSGADTDGSESDRRPKFKANAAVGLVPKSMTKSALRKEAAERDSLRREFLALQEAVKATEIAIPFVFYDGSNIPGGTVRVKKGDYVWVFLDKSRKVGAELGVGDKANAHREWARVGVDDLMIVRGTVIVPHHYDFHFFAMNKNVGPDGQPLFPYSADAPPPKPEAEAPANRHGPLITSASKAAAASALPDISTLEGADDDPSLTKVVDRRWFEKNKHIYPASTWQEFDPEKDYSTEVRKDAGGNTFFFSR